MSAIDLLPPEISPVAVLAIRPWPDEVLDLMGHDPRSAYVEMYWLGILGPTSTWIMRRLASGLEDSPEGFDLNLVDAAAALGLGLRAGRSSPFIRALGRLCQFGLAQAHHDGCLAVRLKVPPLSMHQVKRLPRELAVAHHRYQQSELATPMAEQLRRRCRRLALSLFELGEDAETTEHQLARWRFPPGMCREAAAWARDRHQAADGEGDAVADEPG